jgi:hypothetical protein
MSRYLCVPLIAIACIAGAACDFPLTGVSIIEVDDPGLHPDAGADSSTDDPDGSPQLGDADADQDGEAARGDAETPPCFEGDLTIEDGQEAAYAALTCIDGTLSLATTEALSLPALRAVTGRIDVWSGPATISLPQLESAGALAVHDSELVQLQLPLLTELADLLLIASPGELHAPKLRSVGRMTVEFATPATIALPALTTIAGDAVIYGDRGLHTLSLPSLTDVAGALTIDASALSTLELPLLRTVKSLALDALSPELLGLHFSALEQVETVRVGTGPTVPNGLRTLTFAVLVKAGEVRIQGPDLLKVELPMLAECTALSVYSPKLGDLNVYALTKVAGTMDVNSGTKLAWSFPHLEHVGSLLMSGAGGVTYINLESLTTVAETFRATSMPGLMQLQLPLLVSAAQVEISELGDVQFIQLPRLSGDARVFIQALPRLSSLTLTHVQTLKSLLLDGLGQLTKLEAPALTAAEYVDIRTCDRLWELSLPALTTLGRFALSHLKALWSVKVPELESLATLDILDMTFAGSLTLDFPKLTRLPWLVVQSTQLSALRLPRMVDVDHVRIESNAELQELTLPALRHVRVEGRVQYSPKLPLCQVTAINARLETGSLTPYELGPCVADAPP